GRDGCSRTTGWCSTTCRSGSGTASTGCSAFPSDRAPRSPASEQAGARTPPVVPPCPGGSRQDGGVAIGVPGVAQADGVGAGPGGAEPGGRLLAAIPADGAYSVGR